MSAKKLVLSGNGTVKSTMWRMWLLSLQIVCGAMVELCASALMFLLLHLLVVVHLSELALTDVIHV